MISGPAFNSAVISLNPQATASFRADIADLMARHHSLPNTVVDRNCFLNLAPKIGGLFVTLDPNFPFEPRNNLQTPVQTEYVWDTHRAVKALNKFALSRGVDLLDRPVGFAVLTLPEDAEGVDIASVRSQLYRYGTLDPSRRSITLDPDGEQSLRNLEHRGPSILVCYDLSKLKRGTRSAAGTEFTLVDGADLKSCFLGEITLMPGGSSALALELMRHDTRLSLSDSAHAMLSKFIPKRIEAHTAFRSSLASDPEFPVIQQMVEAESRLLQVVQASMTERTVLFGAQRLIQQELDLCNESDGPRLLWKADGVYPSESHTGIPNTAPKQPWTDLPAGKDLAAVAERRAWLVDRFAQDLATSSNPLDALTRLILSAQTYATELDIAAPRWEDLPSYYISPEQIDSASAAQSVCDALARNAVMNVNGSEGWDSFRSAIPVIQENGIARPCSMSDPYERKVATAAALNFIEEIIHIEQQARFQLFCAQQTKGGKHQDLLLGIITSALARDYFQNHAAERARSEDTSTQNAIISEVDAIARQIELVQKYKLPLEYISAPLFDYHLDLRWRFARWIVKQGIVPREEAPDYLFDDEALQKRLSE